MIVLDTGAFVAIEKGDKATAALIKREFLAGRHPVTHGGVVGQVWRGGAGKQARVSAALSGCIVEPLDEQLGKSSGVALAMSGTGDVIDAAITLLAHDGDEILTSDPHDIAHLADALDLQVDVVPV